ncbi:50S ribosomal protein L6 [Candidatus Hydrogenedentota bacterium]
MSRVGLEPIPISGDVKVAVKGSEVSVEGPKGKLALEISPGMTVSVEKGVVKVARSTEERDQKALHGLTRSLIANMVEGVTKGFEKTLQIEGVGYRAQIQGSSLSMSLGFSHPVVYDPPEGISLAVDRQVIIKVSGIDKQKVGQAAADIRAFKKPEPYKGKGIRYEGEHVRRKAGKAGA